MYRRNFAHKISILLKSNKNDRFFCKIFRRVWEDYTSTPGAQGIPGCSLFRNSGSESAGSSQVLLAFTITSDKRFGLTPGPIDTPGL